MGVPPSRLIADLLGASVGVWGIWNLLRKQHRLRGVALILRWVIVVLGAAVVGAYQSGMLGAHWIIGVFGLWAACFFFAFPDISFYLVMGCQKLTGWPRGPQSRNAHGVKLA